MPTLALANGLWIGEIPDELQDLTYAEQLLIARVHHNRCIVKVSSGMRCEQMQYHLQTQCTKSIIFYILL
jgi:hypothetical protein